MADPRGILAIFSKPPRPGEVKRRLIPALGESGAAALYRRMLEYTLAKASTSGFAAVDLWCTDSGDAEIRRLAAGQGIRLQQQTGADLGQRMANALTVTLARARFAVLIGCDCPALTTEDLRRTSGWLRSGADAVIGPASDGGYYLIALRRPLLDLFTDIAWGTDQVLEETRTRLRHAGVTWHELPEYHDIDRPEDLQYLPADMDWGLPENCAAR